MELKYVDSFVAGTKHVFRTMFDIELEAKPAYKRDDRRTLADVTGVMGFTGDRKGTMSFSTSTEGALALYERLMTEKHERIDVQIIDAVGEITNIISGQARKELEKESVHLTAHVPMVFVGKGLQINYITSGSIVSIPFSFTLNGNYEEMNLDFILE